MKLGQIVADLGFDMRLDVVLARAEQLVRLESNAVIENKTIAHDLRRKVGNIVLHSTEKEKKLLESLSVKVILLHCDQQCV